MRGSSPAHGRSTGSGAASVLRALRCRAARVISTACWFGGYVRRCLWMRMAVLPYAPLFQPQHFLHVFLDPQPTHSQTPKE